MDYTCTNFINRNFLERLIAKLQSNGSFSIQIPNIQENDFKKFRRVMIFSGFTEISQT
jgi:hypothetical protein